MSTVISTNIEKKCIICDKEEKIYKSQRCHECFKKFDAERSRLNRIKRENLIKEDICVDCNKKCKIKDAGKCEDCFKKKAAERTKKHRDIKKEEKQKKIPESEKIPENQKKCHVCNKIKEIGDFYSTHGNKCKDCGKKECKKISKNAKIKESDIICKTCNIEKAPDHFRPNRKKCKDCEKAYGRNYIKHKKQVADSDTNSDNNSNSDSDSDSNSDIDNVLNKNEYYLKRKNENNAKKREKNKIDFTYRFKQSCRTRLYHVIKKNYNTDTYTGCTKEFLKEWLSFSLRDNMTFENYGTHWHIDHVIPIYRFNIQNEGDQMLCFNWKNLSAETAEFNMKKGNDIDKHQIEKHIEKLQKFHKEKNMTEPYDYIAFLKSKI